MKKNFQLSISKVHEIKTPIATQLDFAELLNSQKEQRKKKKHPQNFFYQP